ncbi:hypothetical protein F5884DRAFT_831783 [Xylogone sp. PMI_703]|nr:hypothetical protein F5884DRAFT_831783 [Xylogone sp. PMI_703]
MASHSPSSSALVQAVPSDSLQDAILAFQCILTDDQRRELQQIKAVPDANAVLLFTAELDRSNSKRKGRCISSRLCSMLQGVRDFSTVVDAFVSSHPDIAALVWGSVKLTMLVLFNFASYYEAFSELFMNLGKFCPRFAEYQALYPGSARLQKALCDFHAASIRCCKHVVETIRRPWQTHILKSFWTSFEQEFKPVINDIQRCSTDVKEELALAKAQADVRDQQLQIIERKEASESRQRLNGFLSRRDKELEKIKEWKLQRDEQRAREKRRQLLESLSSYDYLAAFKQNRRKKYRATAEWLFGTPEFERWINGTGHPLFWCSGKMGSGKTILTTSVVDYIIMEKCKPDIPVAYFFSRFDDQESLNAEAIVRCIIKQLLGSADLPKEIESQLERLNSLSGCGALSELLRTTTRQFKALYIVIDGVDECEKQERDELFWILSSLISIDNVARIFIASRDSLFGEIQKRFDVFEQCSMGNVLAQGDITTFIEGTIQDRIENQDLNVGDNGLIEEIKQALVCGAEGMLLWVTFQIEEICAQHCDEDIRRAIKHLPMSLAETFNRILVRIASRGNIRVAQKAFPWAIATRRPLSLNELRECIFIEAGQQYSKPDRFLNNINRIASWCGNLVQINEEEQTIQFVHHTIQRSSMERFQFKLEDCDHYIGEICVTYLNFNDFKTTLARRQKPLLPRSPIHIAQTALKHQWKLTSSIPLARQLSPKVQTKPISVDIMTNLAGYKRDNNSTTIETQQLEHPFLGYASMNWILHTRNFQSGKSATWNLWIQMIVLGHELALTPWGNGSFKSNCSVTLEWSLKNQHYPLILLIGDLSKEYRDKILRVVVEDGEIELLNVILQRTTYFDVDLTFSLAAKYGHLEIVQALLTAGADVNYCNGIALMDASRYGHLGIVNALIAAGADVNSDGGIALLTAIRHGHLEIVNSLIAAGADVNLEIYNITPLQCATGKGYLDIVNFLIAAGAVVDLRDSDRTALQEAAADRQLQGSSHAA